MEMPLSPIPIAGDMMNLTRLLIDKLAIPLGSLLIRSVAGEPAELSMKDGGIRLLHRGNQRYVLVLGTGGGAPSSIDFSVYEGGQLVREGRLAWPDQIPGGRE